MLKHYPKFFCLLLFLFLINTHSFSQSKNHLPIIDLHVHAMKLNPKFAADMCPCFLSSMPASPETVPQYILSQVFSFCALYPTS